MPTGRRHRSLRQDWTLSDDKPTYTDSVHTSCFAADTPVYTLDGPRPIQSVEVGDQVLSQDPKTGILQYQPVTEAFHNKPAMVLKIKLQTRRDQSYRHPPFLESRVKDG